MILALGVNAHEIDYGKVILKHWKLSKENKTIEGSFFMYKNGEVYIEDAQQKLLHFPLASFNAADQEFIFKKYNRVVELNKELISNNSTAENNKAAIDQFNIKLLTLLLLLAAFAVYIFIFLQKDKRKFLAPLLALGLIMLIYSFTEKDKILHLQTTTNPSFVDSAFSPFKPKIFTSWDNTYFYVESKGMPDHQMMTGITGWQQQVPIPQCYTIANGNNAWSIPLNPVIAANPVPVNQYHFLRGAVALAVNGIPIFNPYTNTGVDALIDGQLDNWGGHCGRADDYHYHIAPLHLYGQVPLTKPVAFGLDGFAVYGSKEPDGSNMTTLDSCHGHFGSNGVYHYHGTSAAPYMIGKMVGQVTEDATLQIIPQAAASSIRPAGNPLSGAAITSCVANTNNNGYNLTYTRSGLTYHVNYDWVDTSRSRSKYTFHFISPTTSGDSIYLGFSQSLCTVPTSSTPVTTGVSKTMKRLPDTGETGDYTSTFGEDHDYLINPPYFVTNGNGTATDTVTGLMWQRVDGGEMTYENAIIYCDTLTLGGYSNWRLPSPHEGLSILNLQLNPAIDGSIFSSTGGNADYWWTNTRQADDTANKIWCTNSGGGVGNKPKTETISAGGTKRYNTRAVRDVITPPTVQSHFVYNSNGTTTDSLTNLMWQKIPYSDSLTWENALIYSDSLTLAGYIDWRLPNIKELQSINDEKFYKPSVDTSFFKLTNNKKYWSGSTLKNQTNTQAWFLNTQYGITSYDEKIRRNLVICVRNSSNVNNKYTFNGNGNWDKTTNWLNYAIPNINLPSGSSIYIDPISAGQCNLNITQTISSGASIQVNAGKTLVIPGNLIQQ